MEKKESIMACCFTVGYSTWKASEDTGSLVTQFMLFLCRWVNNINLQKSTLSGVMLRSSACFPHTWLNMWFPNRVQLPVGQRAHTLHYDNDAFHFKDGKEKKRSFFLKKILITTGIEHGRTWRLVTTSLD